MLPPIAAAHEPAPAAAAQVPAGPRLPSHLLLLCGEEDRARQLRVCLLLANAGLWRSHGRTAPPLRACCLLPATVPLPSACWAEDVTSPGCCLSLQVRLGDPEQLAKIMDTDPYFITQVGNGAEKTDGLACGGNLAAVLCGFWGGRSWTSTGMPCFALRC